MKIVKTVKTQTEVIKFYNKEILGSEPIRLNGTLLYMMKENIDFNSKKINRHSKSDTIYLNSVRSLKCNNCCKSIREQQLKMVG
mgnify:CR=1 FL=1